MIRRRQRLRHRRSARDQRGQATILIVGFAVLLAMMVGLVTDATAAYLRRQSLDTLADGAALRGADLAATGVDVYQGGVPTHDLTLTGAEAGRAVQSYLAAVGAFAEYPGLRFTVRTDTTGRRLEVHLSAPLELPLSVPGSPESATVSAIGSAVVDVDG